MSHPVPAAGEANLVMLHDLTVTADEAALLQANGLDSLDGLFAARGPLSLDKSGLEGWRSRERLEAAGGEAGRVTLFLKRYLNPPAAARRSVRPAGPEAKTVAGLEWLRMRQLARAGIACPAGVALGEEFRGGREVRSAVLARAVPGRSLESLFQDPSLLDRAAIRRVLALSADLVARFHRCGWVHRDLYLSHLFFDVEAKAERALHLIDLQRIIRPRYFRRRWIVKDLASLNYSAPAGLISRCDRARWLRTYLGVGCLGAAGKALAYRIVGKTRQIARHDRHRLARIGEHKGRGA